MTFDEWMLIRDVTYYPTDDTVAIRKLRECWYHRDAEIESLRQQLETERMRNVACDVVAMADTPTSAEEARKMLPDYRSAALESVIRRVDECISLRQQLSAALAAIKVKDEALSYANDELRTFLPKECKNYYDKSIIGEALAATTDLENVRLCEKEPVCWIHRRGKYADASLCPLCDGDISRGWEQDQLYRAWEPK